MTSNEPIGCRPRAGVRGHLSPGDDSSPLTPTLSPLARGEGDRLVISRRIALPRFDLPKGSSSVAPRHSFPAGRDEMRDRNPPAEGSPSLADGFKKRDNCGFEGGMDTE